MINGFRLRITSNELKKHCTDRADYHSKRASEYQMELPKIKEAMESLKKPGMFPDKITHMNKSGYRDINPVEDMEEKIRDHSNKSLVFRFFSDHLFEEDYNLEENDLVRLEILKRN